MAESGALITNDAAILGLLAATLGLVFYTAQSEHPFFRKFYRYVPTLLMCYFLPSLYNTFGLIDAEQSRLYFVASRFLLPATLVLLTLSIDMQGIFRLGPKALIMFGTGTAGIILGGPLAIMLFSVISPSTVGGEGPEAVWRGLTTVAGTWIGGGANQAAMKEVFLVSDDVFSTMVAVDVLVASVWLAILLYAAGESKVIDAWVGADTSPVDDLKRRVAEFREKYARIPSLTDLMVIGAVGFGVMGLSHMLTPEPHESVFLARSLCNHRRFASVVHTGARAGGGRCFHRGLGHALHPDRHYRDEHGHHLGGGASRAFRGRRSVDRIPRDLADRGGTPHQGAGVLPGRWEPGERWRGGVRAGGGVRFSSHAGAGGSAARGPRLCHRHVRCLALRAANADSGAVGRRGV